MAASFAEPSERLGSRFRRDPWAAFHNEAPARRHNMVERRSTVILIHGRARRRVPEGARSAFCETLLAAIVALRYVIGGFSPE